MGVIDFITNQIRRAVDNVASPWSVAVRAGGDKVFTAAADGIRMYSTTTYDLETHLTDFSNPWVIASMPQGDEIWAALGVDFGTQGIIAIITDGNKLPVSLHR